MICTFLVMLTGMQIEPTYDTMRHLSKSVAGPRRSSVSVRLLPCVMTVPILYKMYLRPREVSVILYLALHLLWQLAESR